MLFAFMSAMFAATLAPASAGNYKYVVPKLEYWPMIDGVGMGETASRVVRLTDVAWLGNAIGEFWKMRNDFLRSPRVYAPYYQTTNTNPSSFALLNPSEWMEEGFSGCVNYYTASTPVPDFLDENKSLSVPESQPSGYNGSLKDIWMNLVDVSPNDSWYLGDVLFSVVKSNVNSRVLKMAAITNSYWSVKKLHSLKFVSQSTTITIPNSGYKAVTDGESESVNYVAVWNPATTNYVWESHVETNTAFTGSIPQSMARGTFGYIAYAYHHKAFDYLVAGKYDGRSPLETTVERFEFYDDFSVTSGVPRSVVMLDQIEKVYNAEDECIGNDIAWEERIGEFRRISLFEVKKYIDERFAATDASGTHSSTNYTEVKYAFVDTSGVGMYIKEPRNSPYIGPYNTVYRSFINYGTSKGFLSALIDDSSELNVSCEDPREPQDRGDGYVDYQESTHREVIIRVSHLWTVTTVRPRYTCTFDGH